MKKKIVLFGICLLFAGCSSDGCMSIFAPDYQSAKTNSEMVKQMTEQNQLLKEQNELLKQIDKDIKNLKQYEEKLIPIK